MLPYHLLMFMGSQESLESKAGKELRAKWASKVSVVRRGHADFLVPLVCKEEMGRMELQVLLAWTLHLGIRVHAALEGSQG